MAELRPFTNKMRSRTSPRPDAAKSTPSPHPSGMDQLDNKNQDTDQAELSTDAGYGREIDDGERLENKFDKAITSKESEAKEKKKKKKRRRGGKQVRRNATTSSLL